ncbi:MAG: LysM peptidoglycan-binding domain-containing protein [Bacilli bacterium]|nr:LysM peptidoglycan-binding domain-containing protein [Bacilli bacterium]
MDYVVPYTKELTFDNKVAEITTISLEHKIDIENGELNGTFIVSGEYKIHELSVNKEKFKFDLPFYIELGDRVDEESVDFNIDDFTYDIVEDNVVKVNIEFSVRADRLLDEEREEIFDEVKDVETPEELIEENNDIVNEIKEELEVSVIEEQREEVEEEPIKKMEENIESENEMIEEDTRLDDVTKNTINEAIESSEDEYITYHIHIVKDNETLDTICTKYNTTSNIVGEYNDITNIKSGDKLIIPDEVDE